MSDNEEVKSEFEKFQNEEKLFSSGEESRPEKKEAKPDTQEKAQESLKAKASDVEKQLEEVEKKIEKAEEDSTDKRVREKDRYITKLHEERKYLKEVQERYKSLLNEFSDFVEYDDEGLPVKWKDIEKSKSNEPKNQRPPSPTEDDDMETFQNKLIAIAKWEMKQDLEAERKAESEKKRKHDAEEELKSFEDRRIEAINESMDIAVELFPDFNNPESDIRKEAEKIMEENPHLAERTDFNLICARRAAKNLGISPAGKAKEEKQQKKDVKIVEKPSLTSLGRHTSGVGVNHPVMQKISDFEREEAKFRE